MKNFAFVCLALALFASFPALADEPQGEGHSKTYALLPGETLNLTNRSYRWAEIQTDYPVQFLAGPDCHNDYTVQWRCHFKDPADLFVRDLRDKPVFSQPKSNKVIVTVWEQ